jgi:O-antigen/teichoic acid export membrane protein
MATAEVISPVIEEVARPSLRRNFSWTLAGNVVYAGCQWGMLVEIAKLGRPEMVGHFALALAIGAPVYMLTNLQLRAVQATDFAGQHRFCDYFRLRLMMTALGFLAIAVIAVACRYDRETLLVILLVGLAKAFEAMSDIYYGRLQQHEQMDRISVSMVIKGVVSLAAVGAVLAFTGSLPAASAALALAWLAVLLFYDSRVGWPRGTPMGTSSRGVLWRLTRFSAPLGLSMMLISLNANIPRYFVEHYRGAHDLGIFAALSYLVIAGSTVTNALGQAATPRMAAAFATRRAEFYGLLRKMLLLGLAMGAAGVLGAAVFGRTLLRLLYRPEYAERADVLLWLMAAAGLSYIFSFLGYAGTATRVFDRLLVPYLMVTAVTFGASFLVRPFGLTGGAWSMGITYLASCAVPIWILYCASRDSGRISFEETQP